MRSDHAPAGANRPAPYIEVPRAEGRYRLVLNQYDRVECIFYPKDGSAPQSRDQRRLPKKIRDILQKLTVRELRDHRAYRPTYQLHSLDLRPRWRKPRRRKTTPIQNQAAG